jgi:class 3 adenylate cyclase
MDTTVAPLEQRRSRLRAFLPCFIDTKLERRYRDDRLGFRLAALRVSCLAGIAIYLSFLSLDLLTIHDPSVPLFCVRIIGAVALISFLVATFALTSGRWIEPAGFAVIAIQIPLVTTLLAVTSPASVPYYQPTEVFMAIGVSCFILCGVSFIEGAILALCTICTFFITVIVLQPEPILILTFHFAWLFTVIVIVAIGSFMLDRTQHTAWLQELNLLHAEEQIRALLHNILPPSIANRKLAGESPIADRFDDVSLLFADVVDFTALSFRLDSTQVVRMLGDLFSRFDRIILSNGLEKIKTIGDCYMAAAGIPQPLPGHLKKLAHAALEMLEQTKKTRAPDGSEIQIRIGIHSGPVTAGVIGEAKFIFDVWGDTVNTASRMESHGAAGRIQVSETVHTALAGQFDFAGPNIVDVKGMGPTPVWFLQSRKHRAEL